MPDKHRIGRPDGGACAARATRSGRSSTAAPGRAGPLLGAAVTLLAGHGGANALALLRNVAIARLVSPDQFGLAAAIGAAVALADGAGELGLDKRLVQARGGAGRALQATLQSLSCARGLLTAGLLLALAGPLSRLLGTPEAAGWIACAGLVPLLRGIQHLDPKRRQRVFRFRAEIGITLAAHGAALATGICVGLIFADVRAMLGALIAQAGAQALGSHLVARRPYRLALARRHLGPSLAFGWPLMLNGLLIAAMAQGDRLIVGVAAGLENLASYAALAMLTAAPALLIAQVVRSAALPWLAAAQDRPARFRARAVGLAAALGAAAVPFLALGLAAPPLTAIIFGPAYRPEPALACLLAAGAGLRVLRIWPALVSLAHGETRTALVGNLARLVGLGVAIAAAAAGGGAVAVAAAFAAGEGLALGVGLAFARHAGCAPVGQALAGLLSGTATLAAGTAIGLWPGADPSTAMVLLVGCSAGALVWACLGALARRGTSEGPRAGLRGAER